MNIAVRVVGVATLLVLGGASAACRQTEESALATGLDSFIRKYMGWYALPGVAVAVIDKGEVVFARGYGVRNVDTGEPVTPHTLFSTASVTKLFVGSAVLQLVERGLLDLEDPVVEHLPYFQLADERYREITIAHMLSHTSGLPDTTREELYASWDHPEYDDGALERYVRSLQDKTLIAPPGTKSSYSNAAYEVLGDLVAKVSGLSLESYIDQYILRPLGMTDSTLLLTDADPALFATPHLLTPNLNYEVSNMMPYSRRHSASGTLFSNVLDMSRFAIANMNRGELDGVRFLPRSAYDVMWSPTGTQDNDFGLSWLLETFRSHAMYSHGGGDPGYRTEFYIVPGLSIGVVVMTNSWEDEINPIAMKALELLLGEDETDWFVHHRGVIWQAVREAGVEEAVEIGRQLVRDHGESTFHPAILNQLGRKLADLDRAGDALELFRFNVELYPGVYQLRNSLARTYAALGKEELAIETYQQSLELEPDNAEASEFLARRAGGERE